MTEIVDTTNLPLPAPANEEGTLHEENTIPILDAHTRAFKAGMAAFLGELAPESGVDVLWHFVGGYARKLEEITHGSEATRS